MELTPKVLVIIVIGISTACNVKVCSDSPNTNNTDAQMHHALLSKPIVSLMDSVVCLKLIYLHNISIALYNNTLHITSSILRT